MPYCYQSVVSEEVAKDREMNSFLAHLPPDTPVYFYEKKIDLETLYPPVSSEDSFVVLNNISPEILDAYDERLRAHIDYSPPLQTLILTMSSSPHEEAASSFEAMLINIAINMGVYRKISKFGSRRVDTPGRKKQADRSYQPIHQPRQWPTVALEVGYSQPRGKLHSDIAWWINGSRGLVKQGITLDIQKSGIIEILSWVPAFPVLPGTVKVTSSGREVQNISINDLPAPRNDQKIMIKRGKNGGNHTVQGAKLVIPFASLLLEDPGQDEGDFVLTTDILLHNIAEFIWAAMDHEKTLKEGK